MARYYEAPTEQQIREELRKEGIDNLDQLISRVSQHETEGFSEESETTFICFYGAEEWYVYHCPPPTMQP